MRKEEFKKLLEEGIPLQEDLDKLGDEIVTKGEVLNNIFTLFEFMAVIIGAMRHFVPANFIKKSIDKEVRSHE